MPTVNALCSIHTHIQNVTLIVVHLKISILCNKNNTYEIFHKNRSRSIKLEGDQIDSCEKWAKRGKLSETDNNKQKER